MPGQGPESQFRSTGMALWHQDASVPAGVQVVTQALNNFGQYDLPILEQQPLQHRALQGSGSALKYPSDDRADGAGDGASDGGKGELLAPGRRSITSTSVEPMRARAMAAAQQSNGSWATSRSRSSGATVSAASSDRSAGIYIAASSGNQASA